MRNSIFFVFAFCCSAASIAEIIADCKNPDGYAYYHNAGIVSKKDAGFRNDKITGGLTSIVKLPDGKFDILIVDIRKTIISLSQDGGKIVLLRRGVKDATFLHVSPGMVTEIYTLWVDAEGKFKYDLLQNKGGDSMPIHKSAVMVGDCSPINFELIGN